MKTLGFDPALMFVTDPAIGSAERLEARVVAAILGGATSIQLRDKDASDAELTVLAHRLLAVTRSSGVPLIVNDRVEVAEATDADGLHIGEHDMPAAQARRHLASHRLLGLSVTREASARLIDPELVDYVGLGPVFATSSKNDADPPIGLEGVAKLRPLLPVPVVAIGGIGLANAESVVRAGADGIAVISAIAFSDDPVADTAALRQAMRRGREAAFPDLPEALEPCP